jgi:hypothetical protein
LSALAFVAVAAYVEPVQATNPSVVELQELSGEQMDIDPQSAGGNVAKEQQENMASLEMSRNS